MYFPYSELSKGNFAPFVRVRLWAGPASITAEAYVDSGAAYSIFDADTARALGLKLSSGRRVDLTVGDGKKLPVVIHRLPVEFAGYPFRALVGFSRQLGIGFNLVGRATFFEEFRFCFSDRRKLLTVTRTPR